MLPTFNTTNTTTTTQHNFVGKIFDRLCPGNSADTILHASESHMSPFELVLTACVVVAVLSFLPALANLERICSIRTVTEKWTWTTYGSV